MQVTTYRQNKNIHHRLLGGVYLFVCLVKKKIPLLVFSNNHGAKGGTRTHDVLTVPDYKSGAVATEPP